MRYSRSMAMGGAVGVLAPAVLATLLVGRKAWRSQLPRLQMAQASVMRQLRGWTYEPTAGQVLADLITGNTSPHRRR